MSNKIEYIFIHHTATDGRYTKFTSVRDNHINKGWSDIGYHIFIEYSGEVFRGRSDSTPGAHARGFNTKSIGICLALDGDNEEPSKYQIDSLISIIADYVKKYNIEIRNILGHKDVNKLVSQDSKYNIGLKTCPGWNVYALLPEIRKRVKETVFPTIIPPKTKCEKEDCSCGTKCADCQCEAQQQKKDIFSVILEIINKLLKKG